MMVLALDYSARAEKLIAKYVNVKQLSRETTSETSQAFKLREQYTLKCRENVCAGRLPLVLGQKTYYYYASATILPYDPDYIHINMDLRPTETGCNPRCEEPTLNSISTSIPWTRQVHVTVPIRQYGDFSTATSSYSATGLVYRVLQNPIPYLDPFIKFE